MASYTEEHIWRCRYFLWKKLLPSVFKDGFDQCNLHWQKHNYICVINTIIVINVSLLRHDIRFDDVWAWDPQCVQQVGMLSAESQPAAWLGSCNRDALEHFQNIQQWFQTPLPVWIWCVSRIFESVNSSIGGLGELWKADTRGWREGKMEERRRKAPHQSHLQQVFLGHVLSKCNITGNIADCFSLLLPISFCSVLTKAGNYVSYVLWRAWFSLSCMLSKQLFRGVGRDRCAGFVSPDSDI